MKALLVLVASCLAVVGSVARAQERLTPELLFQLRRVSDPQVSPDGRQVLYHVRTVDLARNRGETQLFVASTAGGGRRQLTFHGSNSNGRWAPDGRSIAFLSTRGGAPQVYVMPCDGGEARQVSDQAGGVQGLLWSPKGTHLAYVAEVQVDPTMQQRHPDLPLARAEVYDGLMIRHWDEWRSGRYSHLFVVPAEGGKATDLMPGERVHTPLRPFGGIEQIAWSPDGRQIAYTAKKVADEARSTNSDIYLVEIGGGATRNLTEGMPGYEVEPRFAPDGARIAFLSMARGGFEADKNRLMVQDLRGGARVELTEALDQSAAEPTWTPDGAALLFASETRGTTHVYRVTVAERRIEPLTRGRYEYHGLSLSADGQVLVALRQQTERPYEVVRVPLAGGEVTALSDENGATFARLALPKVEERTFATTDGKSLHAWVVLPPDFDPARSYPMLLYCQGGPQSMVGQWFSYRWNFHLMAAKGYIVLAPNRRGLPGFGQSWNDQISGDWGGQAMQDLLAATDAMQKEPYVDRRRTAAVGASFGGYTIYWLMGNDDKERFCAMIAHCGVFNLESMYHATEELFFVDWDLGGPYWKSPEVRERYERFSPHRFAGNWRTPLLVIHGEKDYRVPVTEGIQAFTAAQLRGVPSRFLYFPEEGHWVLSPQNGVLWQREFFAWLERWCKG
ncbi:MAG: S9 family peptidase [Planctomycetes bacterium]|nr:S9 family peptidase [Planctomycetota bacterium]